MHRETIASLLLRTGSSGGVRERPNRHDWKSCVGKLTVGSNPTSSASGPGGEAGNSRLPSALPSRPWLATNRPNPDNESMTWPPCVWP